MSWIANLDAKARTWPAVARVPYQAFKWLLIVLGAYLVIGTLIQRMSPAYWRNLWNL